jgi:hypothetical protein
MKPTSGFLSLMAATGLFAAATAFATDDQILSQSGIETVAEMSGDQRSLDVAGTLSSSGCIADSMVTGDQRKVDQLVAGAEGSRVVTPVNADECTETGYAMPINR